MDANTSSFGHYPQDNSGAPAGDRPAPALSFARQDPERRLGLPAGRYTQANQIVALFVAIALTILLYVLLLKIPDNVVTRSLTQRGPVPYAIVLFTVWGAVILWVKFLKVRFQRRALALQLVPASPGFVLSTATVDGVVDRLYSLVDDPRHFLLFNRVHIALGNLRNMRRIGDVRETLDSQADHDETLSDSSYAILRGIIWAVPVLGFIGTVLGLSDAIGSFGEVLSHSTQIDELKPALQRVTAGLSVAFETTLQGLLAALGLHMTLTFLKRSEEGLLDACKEYCQKHIVGCLRITVEEEG